MRFYWISKRFSFIDNKQYEDIGCYFDYFAIIYGLENIKRLGLNRDNDSLEDIIGNVDWKMDFDLEKIKKVYPDYLKQLKTLFKNVYIYNLDGNVIY